MNNMIDIAFALYFTVSGASWNGDEFEHHLLMTEYYFTSEAGCHIAGHLEWRNLMSTGLIYDWAVDYPGLQDVEYGCFPLIIDEDHNVLEPANPDG